MDISQKISFFIGLVSVSGIYGMQKPLDLRQFTTDFYAIPDEIQSYIKENYLLSNNPALTVAPQTYKKFRSLKDKEALSLAWGPTRGKITCGSWKTLLFYDVATRMIRKAKGHSNGISTLMYSPDGSRLATGSYDNTIIIWDAKTQKKKRQLCGHTNNVLSLAWSHDSRMLASGSDDNKIIIWDSYTGKKIDTLTAHTNSINSVAWSIDGKKLAVGAQDRTITLWDAKNWTMLKRYPPDTAPIIAVAWAADNNTLAVAKEDDKRIKLYDTNTDIIEELCCTKPVSAIAWSPDRSYLAIAEGDTVCAWNMKTKETLCMPAVHTEKITSLAWNPDSRAFVSGSSDTMVVWDVCIFSQKQIKQLSLEQIEFLSLLYGKRPTYSHAKKKRMRLSDDDLKIFFSFDYKARQQILKRYNF